MRKQERLERDRLAKGDTPAAQPPQGFDPSQAVRPDRMHRVAQSLPPQRVWRRCTCNHAGPVT
jgi:hypothetical protein